jgi:ribosome recycling factor
MSYSMIQGSKVLDNLKIKLTSIQTGQVNSRVLDNILVEAYGSHLHINELATITIPEAGQILITPFDKTVIAAIEKALVDGNIGANPNNNGAGIRLIFPPLTQETRILKTKEVHKILEEMKISVRNIRQDLLKHAKREYDEDLISEDELKRYETDLQKEVDLLNKDLEHQCKVKEEEILKI